MCKCRCAVTDTSQYCLTKLLLPGPQTPRIEWWWAQCPQHHQQSRPDSSCWAVGFPRPTAGGKAPAPTLCGCSEVELTHPVSTLQPSAWHTWGWRWEFRALPGHVLVSVLESHLHTRCATLGSRAAFFLPPSRLYPSAHSTASEQGAGARSSFGEHAYFVLPRVCFSYKVLLSTTTHPKDILQKEWEKASEKDCSL